MKDPINTLQELERNSKTPTDGCAPITKHTVEWLAAFRAQATQRTMDEVAAYVAKRATWIKAQQGDAAPHVISAMVSDALGDTFADVVTWNPLRCSLALHLRSVIRSRLSHERERNEDHPHVDIEAASEHEVNEALLNGGKFTPTKRIGRYVKEFTARLRAAAANDLAVQTLIDLHLQDVTERHRICHITGMKPRGLPQRVSSAEASRGKAARGAPRSCVRGTPGNGPSGELFRVCPSIATGAASTVSLAPQFRTLLQFNDAGRRCIGPETRFRNPRAA